MTQRRHARVRLLALAAAVGLVATGCFAWVPSSSSTAYPITVTSNVVYGQGIVNGGAASVDLRLDVYKPSTGQSQMPLVVVVHGGGFVSGSKTQDNVVEWSRAFAGRGYLVASIDYRLAPTNPVPSSRVQPLYDAVLAQNPTAQQIAAVSAIDDTLKALDFMIARNDTKNDGTVLVGGSAGAVTVDYVAYALDDFGIARPSIGAVVSNWGGFSVGTPSDYIQNPVPATPAGYREPPIFMAHATGDPTVPYASSTAIAARATTVGLEHRLYTKTSNDHGFSLSAELYSPGLSVLNAQIEFVTCQVFPSLLSSARCAAFS
jgi:dienelactone hydrolase